MGTLEKIKKIFDDKTYNYRVQNRLAIMEIAKKQDEIWELVKPTERTNSKIN